MALEPIGKLMLEAKLGGYALGYFESWNLESLQGVIDAAEKVRAPIIIGFNGDFLCGTQRLALERLSWYGALGVAAAQSAGVPCGLIFNECPNDDWLHEASTSGFNLIMPADPAASSEDYERRVKALTAYAHRHGTAVEGELGTLPCGSSGHEQIGNGMTDPDVAAAFVASTQVDLMAVSVGNVHIKLDGNKALDLGHLEKIHRRVSVPLVLHGGTGIAAHSLRAALKLGVRKVNFGTYLKQRYLAALRTSLSQEVRNPHAQMGMGGAEDLMVAGRQAVRDAVLERIEMLGCCGKA